MDNMKKITIYDQRQAVQGRCRARRSCRRPTRCGFHIPRLCYHPEALHRGRLPGLHRARSKGMKNFVASCCYPVADGMKIHTNTKELRQARRDIVELILDNHPEDCHTCERDGNCELQRLVYAMGIRHRHFEGERKHYEKDLSSTSVIRDPDKCILCGRCVRMCSEIQGVHCLGQAHRGFNTVVMPAYNMPFAESVCTTCGQCINVCPTAAFVEKNHTQELFEQARRQEPGQGRAVRPLGPGGHRRGLRPAAGPEHGRPARRRAAAAGLRLRLRHPVRRRPDDHGRRQRVPRAAPGQRAAAADHLLLQRLDEVHGAVLSGPDREYLDVQVADVDGVGPVQDLLGREDEARPEEDPQRRGHVLHGQEVRGGPARAARSTACGRRTSS